FAQIDIFWPFSHLAAGHPVAPIIDLWSGYQVSPLLLNIREAFEFAAFGSFLFALMLISRRSELRKWVAIAAILFALSLVTAFIFKDSATKQNYVVSTVYLLLFLPLCWSQTISLRNHIAIWSGPRHEVKQ